MPGGMIMKNQTTKTLTFWYYHQTETRTDFISPDIIDISILCIGKKRQTKKAIYWLLSKAPHSIEEIAEHFGFSNELVKGFIDELLTSKLVCNFGGDSHRFKAKEKISVQKKVLYNTRAIITQKQNP